MAQRKAKYKPLLYTTTVRNPERVKALLYILRKFNGRILDDSLATAIVAETIRYGLYRPLKQSASIKVKWASTQKGYFAEELLSDEEVEYIIWNNPQQHKEAGFSKGYPSRFATMFDFAKELGLVYFTQGKEIFFSENGHKLADIYNISISEGFINVSIEHPEYERDVFLQAMAKSQRKNPFVRVLNDNIPLILLAQTIKKLNANPLFNTDEGETKGISRKELPLLIFWKDNDAEALYQRIVMLRKEFGYEPSDEVIADICTKEISEGFKEFKMESIIYEYPDEFIRKMRITGLFSLRGAGRFLDINHNEELKIDYIIETYSDYNIYTDEREYFDYMAKIDCNLSSLEAKTITATQSEKLLSDWTKVYSWQSLQNELLSLSKRTPSKDPVLKLLPAPVRLEFLIALSIKSKFPDVRVVPNYSCDDAGLPTSTAKGGVSDIECYEEYFGVIVEVTMSEGRTQTMMEVWPVERHLDNFIKTSGQDAQALFVAPSIFNDTGRQIAFVKSDTGLVIRPYRIDEFIEYLDSCTSLYKA